MKTTLLLLLLFPICLKAQQGKATVGSNSVPAGWIRVYKDSRIGYLDNAGQEIVPPVYEAIEAFGVLADNIAIIIRNGLAGLLDTEGNVLVEPQYQSIEDGSAFGNGLLLVNKDGLFGFIDYGGYIITAPVYTKIELPSFNTLRHD